jgi:tRNA modification GTPase
VTTQAGTTRDTITESIVLGGVTINITDTAGLRDCSDKVEKIGITRSIEELKNSDTIVVLIEPGQSKATASYLKKNNILRFIDKKSSLVVNTKSDSKNKKDSSLELDAITSIDLSAKENTGLSNLKNHLQALATKNQSSENLSLLSTRQLELIKKLNTQILVCIDLISTKTPPDIILVEYQKAISICNSLTGESVTQEVIDKVFSDFCIGK